MNVFLGRITFVVVYAAIAASLWIGSQWWEKGLADNLGDSAISPNGCYRVETFRPFWLLPDMLHRVAHPDTEVSPYMLPPGGYPAFFRLFDNRNGTLISETDIYDLEAASGSLYWGQATGKVSAGMIDIGGHVPDCIGDQPAHSLSGK